MTYYESAEDITITRERAISEITENHGVPADELEDFFEKCGYADTYEAQDVLAWIGY